MQSPQRKLKDIQRLLAAFPVTSQADPALVLHNYLTAIDDWHADHVEDAVTMFIKGEVPGHDGRFAPTAPMLARACGLVLERENRNRYLAGLQQPRLPKPDIEKTPEQRARALDAVEKFVERMKSEKLILEDAERTKEQWDKVNARFVPDQTEEAIRQRLMRTPYTTGSPESERESA